MLNEKSFSDTKYNNLPEPLRSLAKCGKVFGVAVDKKPFLPKRWKEDSHLLKTYSDAVAACDEMILDGMKAVVYMVLTNTSYRLLDFDPDKTTGQLRESQTKAIDYYREKKNPILESSSGVGRHIVVEDKKKLLPKISSSLVESGKIPFEIKHDLMYITGRIIEKQPIQPIDEDTIKRVNAIANPKKLPRSASTTKPTKTKGKRKSKKMLAELRRAIKWCYDNKITTVITNNASFSCFAIGSHQFGLPLDEQEAFCLSQQGNTSDIRARLASTKDTDDDQRVSLMLLFERQGYETEENTPPEGTFKIKDSLGRKGGFEYCLKRMNIQVRYNELVGIEVKLPDEEWQELDDDVFEIVANKYVARYAVRRSYHGWLPFEPSNETMRSVYTSLAKEKPRYNPTREWLKTIEAKEDLAAIDEFIDCYEMDCYGRLAEGGYTKEEIKEYTREFVILMMSGWIRRSLTPGCLNDIIAIIVGPRGCGKGLGLMLQLPPKGLDPVTEELIPNSAFSDRCRISDQRQAWYINRRCSLGEVTELAGFSKPGNEQLKALISATHDKQELKYKNYAMLEPKAYGWVGTSNNKHFKPADGEGDRRTYVNDLGYGFEGGRKAVGRELPKRLNDAWRTRAVGHLLWKIKNGYTGQVKDWSDKVEEMREFMVGQSSKHYSRIEQALIAVAYGLAEHEKLVFKGPEIGMSPEPKPEWEHYRYRQLLNVDNNGWNHIRRHGLPFNPPNYPENMATWIRLLTLHDKQMVDKYGHDTIKLVATEHMPGWQWIEERDRKGFKRCRGWLVPDPTHGDELQG